MKRAALFLAPLALAACGQAAPDPAPSPTASATVAAPRTLIAADFTTLGLGARIEGPQGPEVATVLSADNREIARMTSFVACPEGVTDCNPAAQPEGTVYTYVHRITLAEEEDQSGDTAESADAEPAQAGATLFRTTLPVPGLNPAVGYSKAEAEAALGDVDAISITVDEDQIIWRVTKGTGWKPGATITFWWTSILPPDGPEQAYSLEVNGAAAPGTGPFPAENKPVERGAQR